MAMLINKKMKEMDMTVYRLSIISGIPKTTINDICKGRTDIRKAAADTLYRIAKALNTTVEEILEADDRNRMSFEGFKSTICHQVKDMGAIDFVIDLLTSDKIRKYYDRGWHLEALYLLGMLDYQSRLNEIPLCADYNDIRSVKLAKPVFPVGILLMAEVLKDDEILRKAEESAIPEFKRFNIIENEVEKVA